MPATQPGRGFVRHKDMSRPRLNGRRRQRRKVSAASMMTDIDRQKLLMSATTAIFAVIWAIANLV